MKTKWVKRGDDWRRGPLRVVWYSRDIWWLESMFGAEVVLNNESGTTPEAAMKAADKWAAKMLKALKKMEGVK